MYEGKDDFSFIPRTPQTEKASVTYQALDKYLQIELHRNNLFLITHLLLFYIWSDLEDLNDIFWVSSTHFFFSGYLFQYNEECYKILKTKNIAPLNKVF